MARAAVGVTWIVLSSGNCTVQPARVAPTAIVLDSLEFSVDVPRVAERGRPVPLRIAVRNLARGPQPFEHGSNFANGETESLDFRVTRPSGDYVWSLHWQRRVIQGTTVLGTLAGGERRVFSAVWDQRDTTGVLVASGDYLVSGSFNYTPRLTRGEVRPLIVRLATVPLRIEP